MIVLLRGFKTQITKMINQYIVVLLSRKRLNMVSVYWWYKYIYTRKLFAVTTCTHEQDVKAERLASLLQ